MRVKTRVYKNSCELLCDTSMIKGTCRPYELSPLPPSPGKKGNATQQQRSEIMIILDDLWLNSFLQMVWLRLQFKAMLPFRYSFKTDGRNNFAK